MQYRWNNGDTITPTKLNRIENTLESISNNMIVTGTQNGSGGATLHTLFDDIKQNFLDGKNIVIIIGDTNSNNWSAAKVCTMTDTSLYAMEEYNKNQNTGYPERTGLL